MKSALFIALLVCLVGMIVAQQSSASPTAAPAASGSSSTPSSSGSGILSSLNSKASSIVAKPTSNSGVGAHNIGSIATAGSFYQTALFAVIFLASFVFMLA